MQTFDYNFLKDLSRPSKRKGNVQKSLLKAEKDEEQYEKTIFKHVEPSHQENNFVAFIGILRRRMTRIDRFSRLKIGTLNAIMIEAGKP